MSRLIPICIVVGIIIIGHIYKRLELQQINKRSMFTKTFRNRLIELLNGVMSGKELNHDLYYDLTMDVNYMQRELGADGIAHLKDNLKGIYVEKYQFLINFLPEIRSIPSDLNNYIMMTRYNKSAEMCDDMLIRHLGTLKELHDSVHKQLYNPFTCFSDGIKIIVSLPILILNWLGLISDERTRKAKQSWILRILNFIVVLLSLISAVVTITIGWKEFITIIQSLLKR